MNNNQLCGTDCATEIKARI